MITSEQRAAWRDESKPEVKRGSASTWRDRSTMWCTRTMAMLDALDERDGALRLMTREARLSREATEKAVHHASEGWASYAAEQERHAETIAEHTMPNAGLRSVWQLVCDGEPKMGGGRHVVRIGGEFGYRAEAERAFHVMSTRNKGNLRIQVRHVTDWEDER